MKYKDGIILQVKKVLNGIPITIDIAEEILVAMDMADVASKKVSGKEMVITSVLDGIHSNNSLHYVGRAFDIRVWIYTEYQIKMLMLELKKVLGNGYDIIFEEDHIHIEFDPK